MGLKPGSKGSSGLKLCPREKGVEGIIVFLEWQDYAALNPKPNPNTDPKHSIVTGAMEKTDFIPARTHALRHKVSNIKHI